MKQVLRRGIKDIIVDEIPDPVATPHHVLVRPVFSLISSGTETASIHQEGVVREVSHNPGRIRQVLEVMRMMGPSATIREVRAKLEAELAVIGYSGAGILVEKHPTVTDIEIGERVAYGGEGTGHGETIVTGRKLVTRIPDNVPFEHACFATLGAIALNSVRIAQISLGETVAVIGLGLVGQLVAQLARLQGARVIALDLMPERVKLAQELGAHAAIPGGSGAREGVAGLTGGLGADCVIVAAAAKSSAPARQALEICRDRGRMVIVGAIDMSFPWNDMYLKEIQLYMSRAYGPGSYDAEYERRSKDYPLPYVRWTENRNMEEFLRLLSTGELKVAPLVTHEYTLDQAPSAYQTIMDPATRSLAVLLRYNAEKAAAEAFEPVRRVEVRPAAAVNKNTLQVALVGAGNLARWSHVPNMQKLPDVVLRAVQSGGGVRARNHAERFGAQYATTELDEVLRDSAVDVVMIMSRNQYHAAQSIAALKAGKHVFVEKPMAITEEECREVVRVVKETGRHLMVGFNRRFAPDYVAVKNTLRGRSGPVVIGCRVNSPGISGGYWMADPAIGGAILGEACHFVDLFYWMLESEPVAVSAYSLPTGKSEPVGENNLVASFRFADGSIANLTYSTVGSKTSGGERLEVFQPGSGAVTEDFKGHTVKKSIASRTRRMFPNKGYPEQLDAFFTAIRKGTPQPVDARDGARASLVCLKMMESCKLQQPVAIDLDAALSEGVSR